MKRLLPLFFSLLLLVMASSTAHAVIQETVALETSYSQRIQAVLDTLYGENNVVVRTNVKLSEPRFVVRHTKQSKVKTKSTTQYEILPGYPVLQSLGAPTTPYDSVTTYQKPKVEKVLVHLMVRTGFPAGKLSRAKQLIPDVINLPASVIEIDTSDQTFYELAPINQNIEIVRVVQKWFTFQNILLLVAVIMFILFYQAYQKNQELLRSAMAANSGGSSEGGSGGGGGVQRVITSSKDKDKSGSQQLTLSQSKMKHYFDFVSDDNLDNFVYILKKENMSIENIAVITSFLPAHLASKVILSLDLNQQATVALNMLHQKSVNRANIDKLETHIKNALECLIGGKSHFNRTFSLVPSEVKKKLLLVLGKANPEAYKTFRSNIVIFDDLRLLTDDEIKTLLSELDIEDLAKALGSAEKQVYQRFVDNMTSTAKELFTQTLELKGKTYSNKEAEEAKENILKLIYELESDELFNLSERIKV